MQREKVLEHALTLLEQHGFTAMTRETLADSLHISLETLAPFWPDDEAVLYDSLRYHSQQIDGWRRRLMLDDSRDVEQKLLARYHVLNEAVKQGRYPGCLFIAACSFYPDVHHPIHQLAEQQKQASYHYTKELLSELDIDDPAMVAQQMELILEGCLSKLLVKRQITDIAVAKRLAEDVLRIACCRLNGALS
ncbi:transcriptional regulator [Lonsdalea britannica]|uniref:Transcriptional regulator n=1 Tax=Lonsdalea britannica TaxID=1082704 RepID=A0AAD0SFB7_9GAMM|nr:transcriptional regulator [Lonsdalea britannica]AXW86862.1 transcriptional regulator [Lonsdalea britannica]OSM96965.1 transcriptional regulator [Lonsdalea britannica]OSN03279.1 transcriptional regulator [Lonsdalea britannica]